jgi:hypothetical protein
MSFQPISYYNFLRIVLLFYSFIVNVRQRLWTPPSAFLPMLFVGAEKWSSSVTTLKREYMETNTENYTYNLLESVWIRVIFNIRDVNILER